MDSCPGCRCAVSEAARKGSRSAAEAVEIEGLTGQVVGRYELRYALGAGAVGVVYRAYDPDLDREVALKLMRPKANSADAELARQRMLREGRSLARLTHANVVTVHDVGTWQDIVYVAMEHIEGGTLGDWLQTKAPTSEQIARVFAECARGLAAVHDAGLVHRDVKPQNILIGADGVAQVSDFGLARVVQELRSTNTFTSSAALPMTLTNTGGSVGTPAYMAPEQLRGEVADARSDLYALGVAFYEAYEGARPFPQTTIEARLEAASLPLPEGLPAKAPPIVRRAIRKCLAALPEDRFPSAEALRAALQVRPRKRVRWVLALGAIAMLAGGALTVRMLVPDAVTKECERASHETTRLWEQHQDELAQIFTADSLPFGDELWSRVAPQSEAYAQQLSSARLRLCRDSSLAAQAFDQQSQCLNRQARSFALSLGLWLDGNEEQLRRAPSTIETWPDPAECQKAQASKALDIRVVELQALENAGEYVGALGKAHDLLKTLEQGTYSWLILQMQLGKLYRTQRDVKAAQLAFTEVVAVAEAIQADEERAEAWIHLASIGADEAGNADDAAKALRIAEGVLDRIGLVPTLARSYKLASARLALRRSDPLEAEKFLEEALLLPTGPLEEALTRQLLARALSQSGKPSEMLVQLEKAKGLIASGAGPNHPDIIPVYNSMVEAYAYQGRLEEAFAAGNRALDLTMQLYGPEHPSLSSILNNLSILHLQNEDPEKGVDLARRALAISEKHRGVNHPDLAVDRMNLAAILVDVGSYPEAKEMYEKARDALVASVGPDHVHLSFAELGLAQIAEETGHADDAVPHARRGLALRQQDGVDPYLRAVAAFTLAQVLLSAKQRAEALAVTAQSLKDLPPPENARQQSLIDQITTWSEANTLPK